MFREHGLIAGMDRKTSRRVLLLMMSMAVGERKRDEVGLRDHCAIPTSGSPIYKRMIEPNHPIPKAPYEV